MKKPAINPLKHLSDLLKLEKSDISALYFYAVVSGILSLSLPLGIQSVIHFIQSGQITTSWLLLVLLVISGVVLTGVMQIMQLRITENIQQRIYVRYSFDFAHRFPRFNRQALTGKIPVELMNRFFDVISLQKGFSKVLLDFTSALLQITFSLLVLSLYHPFYIAFSFLLIGLLVLIFRPIIKRGLETSLRESKYKYASAYWLQEIARADWSFRLIPNETLSLNRLDEHANSYLKSREDHFQILWKQFIWMIAIKALIVASLLGLGGYLVISQQINLGQFVAAEVLILLLLAAVEKIIQSLETLYDVCTSLEKLEQVREIPVTFEENTTDEEIELFPMEMIPANQSEIKPVVRIEKGQNTQLTGGNQLKINTFLRQLIDPTVDGKYTPRWNFHIPNGNQLTSGFNQIGWFAKGTHLIEGTLVENVQFGRKTVSEEQVIHILNLVKLTHLYKEQPQGLDFKISKSDKFLSEEERDRLLIARAIASNPQLLIISFIGSPISTDGRLELIEAIRKNNPEATLVIATESPLLLNWNTIDFNDLGL
ncbi:ABC transporter ATP-binding protein [uncultured Fluviicola sp.]|uniref:ABC transporter ATP-binding protein n=1 Tax=uncultured Fluviicola sp. TaxID=463303 RepID=UPI0025DBE120|nr:ABC transporter ATP-binding protein [uncultured Fluviicola sp.]